MKGICSKLLPKSLVLNFVTVIALLGLAEQVKAQDASKFSGIKDAAEYPNQVSQNVRGAISPKIEGSDTGNHSPGSTQATNGPIKYPGAPGFNLPVLGEPKPPKLPPLVICEELQNPEKIEIDNFMSDYPRFQVARTRSAARTFQFYRVSSKTDAAGAFRATAYGDPFRCDGSGCTVEKSGIVPGMSSRFRQGSSEVTCSAAGDGHFCAPSGVGTMPSLHTRLARVNPPYRNYGVGQDGWQVVDFGDGLYAVNPNDFYFCDS